MAITKEKKVAILDKIKKDVKKANSIVFVNFHGLPVNTTTAMRGTLREGGVGYLVAKKTLIKRAFADFGLTGEMPVLDGEIALAYGDDLIAPARGVYEVQKKNPELVKIVGGVFEGRYMDAKEMMTIATIPAREVLYAQFVNLINSPIQGLVMALDQIAKKQEATA